MKISNSKAKQRFLVLFVMGLLTQACGSSSNTSTDLSGDAGKLLCSASLEQASFFEDISDATVRPQDDGPASLRNRHVKVDIDSLKKAFQTGRTLRLDLFKDADLTVQIDHTDKVSEKNMIMSGHLSNDPLSSVTMVVNDDVLVANINREENTRFEIQYLSDGSHTIKEFASDVNSGEEDCLAVDSPVEREETQNEMMMAAPPVIDMLVAYTPAAMTKVGGAKAIKALIQMGVTDTNKAFVNSGVALTVRLVGTLAVAQNDTNDFSGDLGRLASKTDSQWNEVHAERARLGADQVTMVGVYPNNSVAGIGYIRAAASTAFSIVKTSAFSIYSFTHELGHNIGLQHSDGFVNSAGRFRTIMAYGTYTRIPRFSNPKISYLNYATGSSTQNSAALLNRYGSSTSSLMAPKVPVSDVPVPVTPATPSTTPDGSCS